jgi:hypothetical protein
MPKEINVNLRFLFLNKLENFTNRSAPRLFGTKSGFLQISWFDSMSTSKPNFITIVFWNRNSSSSSCTLEPKNECEVHGLMHLPTKVFADILAWCYANT